MPALAELVVQPRQRLTRLNPITGGVDVAYVRLCRDGGRIFRWVPQLPNMDALIAGAEDRVRRAVPAPVSAINPSAEAGAFVNLGLWLAVAEHPPVSVTASVADVWATVEANRSSTTFDLGNGDVVTCAGSGTPIVDPSVVEQGPCGYTYLEATPADRPLTITISTTWTTSYTTSTGRRGTLAPIVTSTAFLYRVREVQTIGTDG